MFLIERLDALVEQGRRLPGTNAVMVDKVAATDLIEQLRVAVPEEVRQAMSLRCAAWLEHAGLKLPRDAEGAIVGVYEISPLYALDREEFKENCDVASLTVGDSLYLE